MNFLLEWIVLFIIATLVVTQFPATPLVTGLIDILVLPVAIIAIQAAAVRGSIGSSLGYALDLARRAGTAPKKPSQSPAAPRLWTFRLHVRALRRWADSVTGGYAEDLLLSSIRGIDDEMAKRPLSFSELARALEFDLVLKAIARPAGEERVPFGEYAQLLRERVPKSTAPARALADLWAGRYGGLPERNKLLAAEHRPRSRMETFKQNIEVWKLVLTFIFGVAALFVGSQIHFP